MSKKNTINNATVCFSFLDGCATSPCSVGQSCISKIDGTFDCTCPDCSTTYAENYVCTSEGRTEASECHVTRRTCLTGRDIVIVDDLPCSM